MTSTLDVSTAIADVATEPVAPTPEQYARPSDETDADRHAVLAYPMQWLQEFRDGAWRFGRPAAHPTFVARTTCTAATQQQSHDKLKAIIVARMKAIGFDLEEFKLFWDWPAGILTATHQSASTVRSSEHYSLEDERSIISGH
ncbi:hypothetical protein HJC99_03175 [Candidatus Saccharibacteria bacterium]|nr:hypothetical protein [Candidatus Saccharibacteria bacterium]